MFDRDVASTLGAADRLFGGNGLRQWQRFRQDAATEMNEYAETVVRGNLGDRQCFPIRLKPCFRADGSELNGREYGRS